MGKKNFAKNSNNSTRGAVFRPNGQLTETTSASVCDIFTTREYKISKYNGTTISSVIKYIFHRQIRTPHWSGTSQAVKYHGKKNHLELADNEKKCKLLYLMLKNGSSISTTNPLCYARFRSDIFGAFSISVMIEPR
ncbi:hypothetical protein HELRODRAFT_159903 [Helobdella robusta]|uniref:Uncharacterized protein n=1 Tax=Helobdella robusta TaxID=6412 RepID=T1EPJ1_HELRO|nr:hypothetical protein HELRODRAFT_159903 [Helobdella robusta]ESO05827.1 hypothetical protein HELRODRAFT_159903 [Helobdella robusta]